jgi:hypothetical protein
MVITTRINKSLPAIEVITILAKDLGSLANAKANETKPVTTFTSAIKDPVIIAINVSPFSCINL